MTSSKTLEATFLAVGVVLAAVTLTSGSAAAADAAKGEAVYKKCKVCHALEPGKHKLGPSLAGLFGRKAGARDGYKFSKDMTAAGEAGLVWSRETFAGYMKKDGPKGPKTYIGEVIGKKKAKIKMAFPGLKSDDEIANLIAYLTGAGA